MIIVEHFDRLSRDPATIQRLKQIFEFNRVELMDQKGIFTRPLPISASRVSTIRSTSPSLPKRFGAGTTTLWSTGRFPARMLMAIGRRLERRVSVRSTRMRAKIVLRIFEEYAAGRSTRNIAADLTREGVPTPGATRHKNKVGRTIWNHQCITGGRNGRGILGNELYVGVIHWNVRSTILNPETQKKQKPAIRRNITSLS